MELHIRDLLSLEYHGHKVANGQLRAKDVAKYISAIDDFMVITSKHAYGKDAELTFDVSGFRNQSFDIDFALQVVNLGAAAMFASGSPKDLIMLTTDCIKACIHLQGQQPKEVQKDTVDKSVHVTNQQGDTQVFHIETINVIADPKAANSLDCFIREPLAKGLEAVKVKSLVLKLKLMPQQMNAIILNLSILKHLCSLTLLKQVWLLSHHHSKMVTSGSSVMGNQVFTLKL